MIEQDRPEKPSKPLKTDFYSPPELPERGEVCRMCRQFHDPERCNDHRAKTEPLVQCGRPKPIDSLLCHAHERANQKRRPSYETRIAQENAKIKALAAAVPTYLPPVILNAQPDLHNMQALPVDNPVVELSRMAGILRDAFERAGQRVNELASLSVETRAGGEQLRGEAVIWEKLIGHLRSVLVDMAKLGLDERLVRLEEKRAEMVAEALFWFVASANQQLALSRPQQHQLEGLMQETVARIVTSVNDPATAER
jgi:hypothetical protein